MDANTTSKEEVEVATGAFIIHNEKVLLATGPKFSNMWTVPGGHLHFKEKMKDCIEREVQEEIGVKINAIEHFSTQEKIVHVIERRERHFIFLNWKCEITEGEPKIDGREFTKFTWMPVKKAIENEKVVESVRDALKIMVKQNG